MANDRNPVNKNTRLHDLMKDPVDNEDDIIRLLGKDPPVDVNIQNDFGQTAMMIGVISQYLDLLNVSTIQTILKCTDFNLTDKLGNTLLHHFARHGVETCFEELLGKCNVLAQNKKGETALHHVQKVSSVKILLKWYAKQDFGTEAKNWPANSLGKSELLTNLEDYLENPDKRPGIKDIIELLCLDTSYPVPDDMSSVIIKTLQSSSETVWDNLVCILDFGAESVGETHIKEAIKSDDMKKFRRTVEHCNENKIETIICSTDVLLACLKPKPKKYGDKFYEILVKYLNNKESQLIDIKDSYGCNIAHYFCKYEKYDLLQDLLDQEKDMVKALFGATDSTNLYPLALVKDPEPKFFELFKDYFDSSQKGFEKVKLASPTVDLLHYAIEKKKKYVNKLLDVGFPLSNDVNEKTPLHKIVRYNGQASLLEKALSCQTEGDDVDYINKKDVFGFTALDYTILYRKEEQFKFLRQRRASIDEIQVEKMINYLAFEKHWNAAELNCILEDLEMSYPTEENKDFVREIKIGLTKSEKTQAPQNKQLSSQSKKDPILFNILVAHSAATPVMPEIGLKQNDNETVVFCHSLPFEMLSIEHLNNFKNLVNKQLYVVQDPKDPSLLGLLSKLLGVEANHEKSVPEIFNLKRGDAKQLQISPPSTDLLSYCPEQEIKLFEERFREDLENHLGKSGYFFVSKCNGFFSKSFYDMSLDVSEIEMKEALVSFKLLDPFYTELGTKEFSKRINSSWDINVSEPSPNHVDFRVMYNTTVNVSRFATPLICSLLISRFMLIPRDGKLLILSPDVLLAFHVNTQGDFVRVEICSESDQIITKEIRQYFSSLLRSREVQIDLKKLDMEIQEGDETVKCNDIELADLESAQMMAPEKETLEGGYHLLRCSLSDLAATFWKGEIKLPVQRYFGELDQSCEMLRENAGERNPKKLLHRLILTKKDYTIREFINDGKYTEKQRDAICKGIGIDVGETYSKCFNCWRLNWADFLVMGLGIVIVVGILVGCEVGGIDLDTYGVAGVATLPFILSVLNRVRMSYSHTPKYSELPALTVE